MSDFLLVSILLALTFVIAAFAYTLVARRRTRLRARSSAPGLVPRPEQDVRLRPHDAEPTQRSAHSVPAAAAVRPRSDLAAAAAKATPSLHDVKSWGMQLHRLDIDQAAASPFDLLVVDPGEGARHPRLRRDDVARLQRKPDGGRRLVLAHCAIGEAESWRGYWNKDWKVHSPSWLIAENPEWERRFAVRFWEIGWHSIVFGSTTSMVDRIIACGFDGLYLDDANAIDELRHHFEPVVRSRPDLEGDMVALIRAVSAYAKAARPGTLVILQNADPLLTRAELRAAIDAAAKEELLYGLDGPERRNLDTDLAYGRGQFDLVRRDGKPVFAIEYLASPIKVRRAREMMAELGYTLAISRPDRELDTLDYGPEGSAE